ncbi:MAG: hypothetical protein ABSD41_06875 [Candidatus Bathyarchaeia archaeon]
MKTETTYENFVNPTLNFRGEASKSLLDAVTNSILDMQKAKMPQKLVIEAANDR